MRRGIREYSWDRTGNFGATRCGKIFPAAHQRTLQREIDYMDTTIRIRKMSRLDWTEVAQLIHDSTNSWYLQNRGHQIFNAGPTSTRLYCEVYEMMDPDCCFIAESTQTRRILGSCFFHPRETHYALGIMNVHPDGFGQGIARGLLREVIELADQAALPIRLVSSAMNLDSFSLYTRAGFVPRATYQDLIITIPPDGVTDSAQSQIGIRPACPEDIEAMGQLEMEIAGVRRQQDYHFFIQQAMASRSGTGQGTKERLGDWRASVYEMGGEIQGWIASVTHPATCMLGPGVAINEQVATSLVFHELNCRRGQTMVFLAPVDASELVQAAYRWGARNCELHVAQVRGIYQQPRGIVLPTFMPETA